MRPSPAEDEGHRELLRKTLHMGTGSGAFLLHWAGWEVGLALAGAGVLFNALLLHRLTGGRLLRAPERDNGWSLGVVAYPGMVFLVILCLPGRLELAAAAWGILAFGDGAAGLVGRYAGGPSLPWNPRKRWSGLVAFIALGAPMAALLIRWTQMGGATGVGTSFVASGGGGTPWLLAGCAAAAIVAGLFESLDSAVDDNVRVPVVAAATLLVAASVEPHLVAGVAPGAAWMGGAALLAVVAGGAFAAGAVSVSGALGGWLLVAGLLAFGGWPAVMVFSAFFGVATGATWLGRQRKEALGLAQERGGRRGASHAAANAGAGLVFAFLAACGGAPDVFSLAMVAAFATAAFDTVASEVGQAYGRTHVVVSTLRRVPAGTEGAVSLEGTLAGLVGSALVAAVAVVSGFLGWGGAGVAVAGATVGAMLESVAGAYLPAQRTADNGLLNLGATLAGAGAAVALGRLLG